MRGDSSLSESGAAPAWPDAQVTTAYVAT
jgi:hypothetical protein